MENMKMNVQNPITYVWSYDPVNLPTIQPHVIINPLWQPDEKFQL